MCRRPSIRHNQSGPCSWRTPFEIVDHRTWLQCSSIGRHTRCHCIPIEIPRYADGRDYGDARPLGLGSMCHRLCSARSIRTDCAEVSTSRCRVILGYVAGRIAILHPNRYWHRSNHPKIVGNQRTINMKKQHQSTDILMWIEYAIRRCLIGMRLRFSTIHIMCFYICVSLCVQVVMERIFVHVK